MKINKNTANAYACYEKHMELIVSGTHNLAYGSLIALQLP